MSFTGFPVAALDFYDDLEQDNTKSFWAAHKHVWEESVRDPMVALTETLAPEFGAAKVFRPYRDVRFSKDKTPYKTHQGAFVATGPSTGYYVQLSAGGVMAGAGFYDAAAPRLAAVRRAIDDERSGEELASLLAALEEEGWVRGGDSVKTAPRGYPVDHPRIALLRHKSLTVRHDLGFGPVVQTAELADLVAADWRAATPLLEWLARAAD